MKERKKWLLTTKGNGRNYLGYDEHGNIHEVLKDRGRFYRCKLVIGEGLVKQGEPLKKKDFILASD